LFFRPLVEPLESRRLLSVGGEVASALVSAYGQTPLSFEPNQGQTDSQVQYLSHGSGYTLFLTASAEAVLRLQQPAPRQPSDTRQMQGQPPAPIPSATLDVRLVGANSAPQAAGLDELPGKSNYFIGGDPKQWHSGVANYGRVQYQNVYSGIDLAYYGNQGQLEYDFTVAPGADPKAIKLDFQGADSIDLDAQGNLVLHTTGGDVVEHTPVIYQEIAGARQAVAGKYVLKGDHKVGFEVGAYDASAPLVIDPVLVYSTFLGGNAIDFGYAIAVDNSGDAYVTGETASTDFPANHALRNSLAGAINDINDAFIAKLTFDRTNGVNLVYSTYLGASNPDPVAGFYSASTYGSGIAIDDSGEAYVTGTTANGSWPSVSTSADGQPLGSDKRNGPAAFVIKLSPDGGTLIYSSPLGGSDLLPGDKTQGQATYGNGIAVGRDGAAYLTGSTESPEFPTTAGAYQAGPGGTQYHLPSAFVMKIDPSGAKFDYSTYLRGAQAGADHGDYSQSFESSGRAIAVDAKGNAFVAGSTRAGDFPNTASGLLGSHPDGGTSAFVTEFNADGSGLVYSAELNGTQLIPAPTFFGGGSSFPSTYATGIAVDGADKAYITGSTGATDLPTVNPFQAAPGLTAETELDGEVYTYVQDAFVTGFSADGQSLVYSTYLGGAGNDYGNGIALDPAGHAYVAGYTGSTNFPTKNAIQPAFGGGSVSPSGAGDSFVTKLSIDGQSLMYSTYLGGTSGDLAYGVAVDAYGGAYVIGSTSSPNFPVLHPLTEASTLPDAFITRISGTRLTVTPAPVSAFMNSLFSGVVATFTSEDTSLTTSDFKATVQWGDGTTTPNIAPTQPAGVGTPFQVLGGHTFTKTGAYPIVVTVDDVTDGVAATTAVDVSGAAGNQSETTIAVDPKNPSRLFEASNDEAGAVAQSKDSTKGGLFAAYSGDGGASWTLSDRADHLIADGNGSDSLPAGFSDPRAVFDQFGNLFLTYVASDKNTMVVALSSDGGKTFTEVGSFQPAGSSAATVDYPAIAVGAGADPKDPNSGSVWVAFADLADGSIVAYGAPVTGPDAGAVGSFSSNPEVVATPKPTATSFNFASIAVGPLGQVLVSWQDNASFDGATLLGLGPDKLFTSLDPDGLGGGGFGAAVVATSTNVGASKPIPPQFDRRITANATLAWDLSGLAHQGRAYFAYTDAYDPLSPDTTINLRYSDDNGATWSDPARVDDTDGKESLFQPRVAVDQTTGNVAVAWYDTRNDHPNRVKTQVFVATSGDGGKTFSPGVPVSAGSSDATDAGLNGDGKANQYGDYQGLAFNGGSLYPAWSDNSAELGGNPDVPQFDAAAASVAVANVSLAPLTVRGESLSLTQGQAATGEVALFVDNDSSLTAANFIAQINWGDAQPVTAGAVVKLLTPGLYEVDAGGGHSYQSPGSFPIVVTVQIPSEGITASNLSDASIHVGNENSATIATDPTHASNRFFAANTEGFKGLIVGTSTDGGAIWHSRVIADGGDALTEAYGYPKAVFDQFGNLFLTYVDSTGNGIAVAVSEDGGQTLENKADAKALVGVGPPAIGTGPGADASTANTWVYAKDLGQGAFLPFGFASTALGALQAPAAETVPGPASRNFGSIAVGPHGQVLALAQNASTTTGGDSISTSLDPDGTGPAPFGTPVFATNTSVTGIYPIPAEETRGITAQASLVWDRGRGAHSGRAYLAYTDAAPASTATTIYVRSSDDDGKHWSDPVKVDNQTGDASRFLPSAAVDQSTGDLAVGWYDTSGDVLNLKAEFFVAISGDGGQTFSPAVSLSLGPSNASDPGLNPFGLSYQYGNYTGLTFDQGLITPAFPDNSSELAQNSSAPQFDVASGSFGVAHVADLPITATAIAVVTSEGGSLAKDVASFTDADSNGKVSDFTATIDWGDGDPSAGTIVASSNGFIVSGTHAYEEEGTHAITVTIQDQGGASATVTGAARVTDGQLTAVSQDVRPIEGQLFSGPVATFGDEDPNSAISDYTVNIDWGDGGPPQPGKLTISGSAALAVAPNSNTFYTIGNYDSLKFKNVNPQDDGVPYLFKITLDGTLSPLLKLGSTFTDGLTINPADRYLYTIATDAAGVSSLELISPNFSAVTPAFVVGSGFHGGVAFDPATQHIYAITTDSSGASTLDSIATDHTVVPLFSLGTRTYGGLTYDADVDAFYAIGNDSGGVSTVYRIDFNGTVTEQFLLGDSFTGGLAFNDFNPGGGGKVSSLYAIGGNGAADFNQIPFNPAAGSGAALALFEVEASFNDGVVVSGSHTYAEEQTTPVNVTIRDSGGAPAVTAAGTATVVDFAPTASPPPETLTAFQGLSTGSIVLASFTVPGGLETGAGEYTATITWGDGSASEAGALAISGGTITVSGSHAYATAGAVHTSVTLSDDTGNMATSLATILSAPDVSAQVRVIDVAGPVLNGVRYDSLTITNVSASDIPVPLFVEFKGLTPGVTSLGAQRLPNGDSLYTVTSVVNKLQRGQTTRPFEVPFRLPAGLASFSFTAETFDGPSDNAAASGLVFEANVGQAPSDALFVSHGAGSTLYLTSTEAVLSLQSPAANGAAGASGAAGPAPASTLLHMRLVGANTAPDVAGIDPLAAKVNYLVGPSSQWHTGIPTFGRVEYQNVYPGIDLDYRGSQRQLEYDFTLAAGVDPRTIALAFQGADSLTLDAQGDLVLHTAAGDVVEQAPVIYQAVAGARRAVTGGYVLEGADQVGFQVGAYDTGLPLVIDPVLVFSTYLGGARADVGAGIAVDSVGNVYVTGVTESSDFPTLNAFQSNYIPDDFFGGHKNAFVSKFDIGGALVYSTYLGGSDGGAAIAVDAAGNAYITGSTYSTALPTVNPLQPQFFGPGSAFVAKLSANGSTLLYSTYLGGGGRNGDTGTGIAVDAAGDAYVTGMASSRNFPTKNALQATNHSLANDGTHFTENNAFVAEINPAGSALVYSTYLGGSADDRATGIAVDAAGAAYVTGTTRSYDFPTTADAVQPLFGSGTAFKTTDGGNTWTNSGLGVPIAFLAVDPNQNSTLYATGPTNQVESPFPAIFKSTDGGGHWAPIVTGLTGNEALVLVVDPVHSGTLYAVTDTSRSGQPSSVFKSTDGGAHWLPSGAGLVDAKGAPLWVGPLAIDPKTTTTLYAGTGLGIFKTTDGGATWNVLVSAGLPVINGQPSAFYGTLVIDPQTPATMYGTFGTNFVYKSVDGGVTWTHSNTGLPPAGVTIVVIAPSNPAMLYATDGVNGVFLSTDGGATWTARNMGLSADEGFITALAVDPTTPATVYIGIELFAHGLKTGALFTSTDSGATWHASGTGLAIDPRAAGTAYAGRVEIDSDVFVAKLAPGGASLAYSTYLGGAMNDFAGGDAVDSGGNAYVTGGTDSNDYPTAGALQAANHAGTIHIGTGGPENGTNAFVTKLNAAGSALVYSTYLGGASADQGQGIAVDAADNAYLAGQTSSSDFPIANAVQAFNRGSSDAFLAKLNAAGSTLLYSTYFGGRGDDSGNAVAVDASRNAYLAGTTASADLPTLNGAQSVSNGDIVGAGDDAFVARIADQGSGLLQVRNLPIRPIEGVPISGLVAAFTDTDSDAASSFMAQITWGDGTSSTGMISADGAGGFDVASTHTYAAEGQHAMTVSIRDADGATAFATSSTATDVAAGYADYHVSVDTSALAGTTGFLDFQFNAGPVPGAQAAEVSVTNFVAPGGVPAATATATGGISGTLPGALVLDNTAPLDELRQTFTFGDSLSFDARLSGAALTQPSHGLFGSAFSLQLLAADGLTAELTTDLGGSVVTVAVGPDGDTHAQSFAAQGGGVPIAVAVASNSTFVADAALTARVASFQPVENTPFAGLVATFTDANPWAAAADFYSVIDWGDGSPTSAGTIAANARGGFDVSGNHTYARVASFPLAVTITDQGAASALAAPQRLGQFDAALVTPVGTRPGELVAGDLNGDGKLDLVVVYPPTSGTTNMAGVLLGNGDGTYQSSVEYALGPNSYSAVLADVNGDGKFDLVTNDCVLLGNGDGTFQAASIFAAASLPPGYVVTGDFNGDGKLDLAVACGAGISDYQGGVGVYLGNGDGTFQPLPRMYSNLGYETSLLVGDFNGDHKTDLVVTHGGASSSLLLGNGDGTFQAIAVAAGDAVLAAGDFNGDGKLDLVTSHGVWLGNGDATFQNALSFPDLAGPLTVGDFNGDGKLDLAGVASAGAVVGTSTVASGSLSLLLGNGDGTFQAPRSFPGPSRPQAIVAGDFNGDGKLDLAATDTDQNVVDVFLGNGDGSLRDNAKSFAIGVGIAQGTNIPVAVGDFSADGKLDVAAPNVVGDDVSVLRGDGDGQFAAALNYPTPVSGTYGTDQSPDGVVAADFNGDGKPDLVLLNPNSGTISVRLGNGDHTFQPAALYAVGANPTSIVAADFNGDGKFDLTVADAGNYDATSGTYQNTGVSVLLGNGDGTFQAALAYAAGTTFKQVTVADFNGDRHLDLVGFSEQFVLGVGTVSISVLLGKGDGTFQAPSITTFPGFSPDSIAVGDFNGDGKPDVALANEGSFDQATGFTEGQGVSVMLGNGDGTFQAPALYSAGPTPIDVAVGDFNGDGKADLVVVDYGASDPNFPGQVIGGGLSVLLGNGDGGFQAPIPVLSASENFPSAVLVGDFNNDGKLDVATRSYDKLDVLIGKGDGTFLPPVSYYVGGEPNAIAAADFDGDGRLDLVTSSYLRSSQASALSGMFSVLRGNGDGTFQGAVGYAAGPQPTGSLDYSYGQRPTGVASGDFNGDGKLDLVTANLVPRPG
jgi:hypothetical protein